MKLKKRIASALLAGVMAVSMAVPAFAAQNEPANLNDGATANVKMNGELKSPVIKVTVPTTMTVVLNPYSLQHVVAAKDSVTSGTPAADVISDNQIVFAPIYMANYSASNIKVSVTATGSVTSADTKAPVSFATATTNNATKPVTTKSVFMYLDLSVADADPKAPSQESDIEPAAYAATNKTQLLVAAKAATMTDAVTMAAATVDPDFDYTSGDYEDITLAVKSAYAVLKVGGDCAGNPTSPWVNGDAVNVDLAFTFAPTSNNATGVTG